MTDASYTSDFFDNIRNFSAQRHDGYVLVNAGVSWLSADKSWKLKAYVRNLFEENYVETAFDIATLCGCSDIQYSKRSEEHTSELQSLMRISYAVFCLKKKTNI